MSDQTPDSEEPEEDEAGRVRPRHQSAAERRSSETVMLDSGNLDDLVAQAKATPAAEAPAEATPPAASSQPPSSDTSEASEGGSRQMLLIVGVIVIIVIAFVIAWIVYK